MRDNQLIEFLIKNNADIIKQIKKEIQPLKKKRYYSYKEAAGVNTE